jgi:hypothetical protein
MHDGQVYPDLTLLIMSDPKKRLSFSVGQNTRNPKVSGYYSFHFYLMRHSGPLFDIRAQIPGFFRQFCARRRHAGKNTRIPADSSHTFKTAP